MKKFYPFGFIIVFITLVSIACSFSMPSNANLEKTKIALAVEQTKLAMMQSGANLTSTAMANQNPSTDVYFHAFTTKPNPYNDTCRANIHPYVDSYPHTRDDLSGDARVL